MGTCCALFGDLDWLFFFRLEVAFFLLEEGGLLGGFEAGIFSKGECLVCWEPSVSSVSSEPSDSSDSSDSDVEYLASSELLVLSLPREMLSGADLVSKESASLSSSVVAKIDSKNAANESQNFQPLERNEQITYQNS